MPEVARMTKPGSDRNETVELDWQRDGVDWPNREYSRFLVAGGIRWHVQQAGEGAGLCLLIHGMGASTHSWRRLLPRLSKQVRVVALDLPGHGFTSTPPSSRLSLPGMVASVDQLLSAADCKPDLIVGHSAGAAIACRLVLEGRCSPSLVVSLNGALLPTGGAKTPVLGPLTRRLLKPAAIPNWVARRARRDDVFERLMGETGSTPPVEDLAFYKKLAGSPKHVAAALRMMAHWDSRGLAQELASLGVPLWLVAAEKDGMVPAAHAKRLHEQVPNSRLFTFESLGHLAHEEDPDAIAEIVEDGVREYLVGP